MGWRFSLFIFVTRICVCLCACTHTEPDKPVRTMTPRNESGDVVKVKMNDCIWGDLNTFIYAGCDDGAVRIFDVDKEKQVKMSKEHDSAVHELQFSKDETMFVTASGREITCVSLTM